VTVASQKRPRTTVSVMPPIHRRIAKIKKASPQDHAVVERRTKVPRVGPTDENLMNSLLRSFNEKAQSENEIEPLKIELARAEQKRKDDLARMQQQHDSDTVERLTEKLYESAERRQEAEGQLSAAKAKTRLLVGHVKAKTRKARKTVKKDEKKAAKSKETAETLEGIYNKIQELVEAQDRIEI
jgi:hypothetical protein